MILFRQNVSDFNLPNDYLMLEVLIPGNSVENFIIN